MSDTKKYLRTEHGERIDQPDFQHAAERSQHNGLTQTVDGIIVGRDRAGGTQSRQFVLKGFSVTQDATNPNLLNVTGGTAILGYAYNGQIQYGAFTTKDSAKVIDAGNVTDAAVTYGLWVRFALVDDDTENRAFWNARLATPVEYVRSVPTRYAEDWELTLSVAAPGDEWMQIATVLPGSAPTDTREFFFEGVADTTPPYRVIDAQWGGGTDRDADRAEYGIFGFRRFVRAAQRQLQDIIGAAGVDNWWDDTLSIQHAIAETGSMAAGANLKYLKQEGLSRLGDAGVYLANRMFGSLHVDTSNTHNIGEQATPWADVHAGSVFLGLARQTAALADDPRIAIQALSGYMTKILSSTLGSLIPDASTFEFVHLPVATGSDPTLPGGSQGSFGIAVNCFYDNTQTAPNNVWDSHDTDKDSYLFEFGTGTGDNIGFRTWFHSNLQPDPWNNEAGASHWIQFLQVGDTSSGGAELTGALTTTGTITTSSNVIASGNVAATGAVTSASAMQAGTYLNVVGTKSGQAIGDLGTLYQGGVPRQVGYVTIEGAGGIAQLGTHYQVNGTLDAAVTANTLTLTNTADTEFSFSTSYVVFASCTDLPSLTAATGGIIANPTSSTAFEIYYNDRGGSRINWTQILSNGESLKIQYLTFGL